MSDFQHYAVILVTGELQYQYKLFLARTVEAKCLFFLFQVAGGCGRSFPANGINDGLCGERWYRQVLLGPPLHIQLPDSLNICHLSVRTQAHSLCRFLPGGCLHLRVPTLFPNKLNKLILALYNSKLRVNKHSYLCAEHRRNYSSLYQSEY